MILMRANAWTEVQVDVIYSYEAQVDVTYSYDAVSHQNI